MNQTKGEQVEKKPYYFSNTDEGRCYFETPEKFLQHLQDNDEMEVGCDMLTDNEWAPIAKAEWPDKMIDLTHLKV